MTQKMEFQTIIILTHNHYKDIITRIPQQMHNTDNISPNQYIKTLFKNPALVT